jgi:hypothetical protein
MERNVDSVIKPLQNVFESIISTVKTVFLVVLGLFMVISVATTPVFYVGIVIVGAEITKSILGNAVIGMFGAGIIGMLYYIFIFGVVLKK